MLNMNTLESKNSLIIELDGALDSLTGIDFRDWIEEKMLENHFSFALDLSRLEYMSSRGIGGLLETQNRLEDKGGSLALFSLSPEVHNLIHFLKIQTKIPTFKDLDSALFFLDRNLNESLNQKKPQAPEKQKEAQENKPSEPMEKPQTEQSSATLVSTASLAVDPEPARSEKIQPSPEKKNTQNLKDSAAGLSHAAASKEAKGKEQKSEAQSVREESSGEIVFPCNNCNTLLRAKKSGKYLCPACRYTFSVSLGF